MVIKCVPVHVPEIARFAHPQDHRLYVSIESPEHVRWRNLDEIPGPYRIFDRLHERVLADTGRPTEHERMIYLLAWALHAMREPANDMTDIFSVNLLYVIEPGLHFVRISRRDVRRPIQIEHGIAGIADPSAFRYQPVPDERWLARHPCHLLDGAVLISHVLALIAFLPHWIGSRRASMLLAGHVSRDGAWM